MDILKTMEQNIESILIYTGVLILCLAIIYLYVRKKKRESRATEAKVIRAKENGMHEPISLHPYIDVNKCIQTGACVNACHEHDILGIVNGKATLVNASQCVGHGACFEACPTGAISLRIGTERRGVELPHIDPDFETNVPGIYIAGELGGMGLIRNAVEQGRQATENISKSLKRNTGSNYDLIIIGAGPAGISASLTAKKNGLKFILLEQDTLGGTVFTFPRKKIVMTSPMELSLFGRVKLFETSKRELLDLWNNALGRNNISIIENSKVDSISKQNQVFSIVTSKGDTYTTEMVLLCIGRRGTPRKLNVPGENKEKVAYRLLEPELISNRDIVVVGGGDSAVESALLLADENRVVLSYRNEAFNRLKPANNEAITRAIEENKIDVRFSSNLTSIDDETVSIKDKNGDISKIKNDLVYIFAGGELPVQFLEKAGITITKKFGETVMSRN